MINFYATFSVSVRRRKIFSRIIAFILSRRGRHGDFMWLEGIVNLMLQTTTAESSMKSVWLNLTGLNFFSPSSPAASSTANASKTSRRNLWQDDEEEKAFVFMPPKTARWHFEEFLINLQPEMMEKLCQIHKSILMASRCMATRSALCEISSDLFNSDAATH